MAQVINVIGYGDISFPDGMSMEEITKALEQLPPAPGSRSLTQDLIRQAGLTARAAGPIAAGAMMGGAVGGPPGALVGAAGMGLGQMIGDPLVNLFNLATNSNVQPPSQALDTMMTRMGLPAPETSGERITQDVLKAGTTAGGMARGATTIADILAKAAAQRGVAAGVTPGVLSTLGQYPAQQVAAAGAAGAAGGALREGGAGPAAQMGGAMLAGMVAPGGPKLPITQRVGGVPAAMVKPFTEEGRQVIVGNVLNRIATNPQQAMQNMVESAPLVPGVRPTAAATARDPGLAGAETAIRGLDTGGNLFGQQINQNQEAILNAFRQIGGKPGSIPYAEAKRSAITTPMRVAAFQGVTVNPETFQSGIKLVVNQAIDNVMSSPVGVRKDVETAMKFAVDRVNLAKTPEELYEVRKDLAKAANGAYNQENPSLQLASGQLKQVIAAADDVIEAAAPGYADYMTKYKKSSSAIDQMRLLQGIEAKVTTGLPNLSTGNPVLAASALRRQLASAQDELGTQLSQSAQSKLDNIINEINRGQAATAPGIKPPGSDTFKNMSMGNLIGRVFSESMASNTTLRTMTRPLDWLYKLPDEQVQQLLVQAMLDPRLAAQMMAKANIMRVEPLSTALRQKAQQMGFGTLIGTGANQ
jgi:hypothetical protein